MNATVEGKACPAAYGRPKQRMFGPAATAMYCLPPAMNVIGEARQLWPPTRCSVIL